MAEKKNTPQGDSGTTRRGFIGAIGAAAAASALPAPALGAAREWGVAVGRVPALRAAYLAEVERLAETLRPRFESGELHGWNSPSDPADSSNHPTMRLEDELAEYVCDFPSAYLVLACSPAETGIDGGICLADAQSAARECLVTDVFRAARERGWWRPGADEYIGEDEWRALHGPEVLS
jgi:hypothetical protein